MQNPLHQMCRRHFDFTAYLNGDAQGHQKARFEQHLCVCDDCFETLINVLNQHLDRAGTWAFDLTARRNCGVAPASCLQTSRMQSG